MHVLPARPGHAVRARARLGALRGGPVEAPLAPDVRRAEGGRHRRAGDGPAGEAAPFPGAGNGWVPDLRVRRRGPGRPVGRGRPARSAGSTGSGWPPEPETPVGPVGSGWPPEPETPLDPVGPGWPLGQEDPVDPVDRPDGGEAGGQAWAARLIRRGPWGALAQRWVPEPLRDARVDPGRRGALLLSVVAALAAVVAAVGVWSARPEPRPVTPVALTSVTDSRSAADPAGPAGATGRAGPASATGRTDTLAASGPPEAPGSGAPRSTDAPPGRAGPMVVSVTGNVRRPGLVTVPAGSRVADAITAAGGAKDPSDLTGLNLAARLSDGDSVVVAGPTGSTVDRAAGDRPGVRQDAAGPTGTGAGTIDLNTADAETLTRLPGVGPVTAGAIVAWRTEHGSFTSVAQLQAVSGIGPAKYAQISPHVTV